LDRQDVADLFALREAIEGMAAALAATNINHAGNRDRAVQLLHEVQSLKPLVGKSGIAKLREHNTTFHETIMQLSQNKYIRRSVGNSYVPALRSQYFDSLDRGMLQASLNEHEQIVLAILDGDIVRAERLMRAHIKRAARQVQRLSDDFFCGDYVTRRTASSETN
jgi:DNA-binding GntR family transcriptional regulator